MVWRDLVQATRGELLKLWKRPAFRILALITVALVLVQYYIVSYISYRITDPTSYPAPSIVLGAYSPDQVVRIVIGQVTTEGPIIGIVLGAVLAGSEYRWGTVKTVLIQQPSRLAVYLAQVITLLISASSLVFTFFTAGGIGSVAITLLAGAPLTPPSYPWLVRGIGDSWTILAVWTMWGGLWATLLRGVGPGIAAGYAWITIDGFLSQVYPLSNTVAAIDKVMPFSIDLAIQMSFPPPGQVGNQLAVGLAAGNAYAGPWILVAYLIGLILIGAITVRRRDIA